MSALLCAMASLALSPVVGGIEATKLTFTESLRKEVRSVTEVEMFGSSTTTEEASKGKAALELTLKGSFSGLTRETVVTLNVGGLKINQTLGSDSAFTSVSNKAELKQYIDPAKPIKIVASSLKLSWTPTLMTMKYTGDVPTSPSLLAATAMAHPAGAIAGDAEITGSIGDATFKTPFSFTGKLGRVRKGTEEVWGSVTTLSLKGKL